MENLTPRPRRMTPTVPKIGLPLGERMRQKNTQHSFREILGN
jgi:hypothetical protein